MTSLKFTYGSSRGLQLTRLMMMIDHMRDPRKNWLHLKKACGRYSTANYFRRAQAAQIPEARKTYSQLDVLYRPMKQSLRRNLGKFSSRFCDSPATYCTITQRTFTASPKVSFGKAYAHGLESSKKLPHS
jgi:hypothetical protein